MEQCPKNGEEGVNTVFPRLANIDSKPNRADLCLTNAFSVFVTTTYPWLANTGRISRKEYNLQPIGNY